MADKTLIESKKAKSAWLGTAISLIWIAGAAQLGLAESLIQLGIGAIVGMFGSQIVGQTAQDVFNKPKE